MHAEDVHRADANRRCKKKKFFVVLMVVTRRGFRKIGVQRKRKGGGFKKRGQKKGRLQKTKGTGSKKKERQNKE